MNNDVLTEILLHLPVQSLFRFRSVCKFWGYVIDSPSFRKLHNNSNNSNKLDDAVCLQVSFPNDGNREHKKLSIKLEHNDKSLMSYKSDYFNGFLLTSWGYDSSVSLVGLVKGLICIKPYDLEIPIAICNPFLGQLKILPLTTSSFSNSPCQVVGQRRLALWHGLRMVAIGFDEDYKVVQLLACKVHRRLHSHLYSPRTNSWRELAKDDGIPDDLDFKWIITPIESWCKNGHFAHWLARHRYSWNRIILSLDMKKEVFRTVTLPDTRFNEICAIDEHSFLSIVLPFHIENINLVGMYESRCEGSKLSWNHVMNVEVPFIAEGPLCRGGCVFFKDGKGAYIVYDYRARKLIGGRFVPLLSSDIVECRGSFVSV